MPESTSLNHAHANSPIAIGKTKKAEISWSPWLAIIIVVATFLSATVLGQLVVSIYPAIRHWTPAQSDHWLNASVAAQFSYTLIAYGVLLGSILWFVRWRGVSLRTIGIKRPRWRDLLYGMGSFPLYFLTYGILLAIVSAIVPALNVDQKQQIGFQNAQGAGALLLTFVSLAVIPPIVEETVMRGFLFTSLRAKLSLLAATVLTSLVFAAGHLQFGSGAPLLWVAAIDTFTLSLFLIFLRQKTDSLWASIVLHALKNSLAFLYIFILHKG